MKPITTNFDVDSELSIQMHRVSPGGSVNSSRRKPPPRLGGSVSRSRALDPTAGSVHRSHPGVSPRPGGTASRSEKSLGKIGRGSRKNHTPSGRCLNFDSIAAAPMNKPTLLCTITFSVVCLCLVSLFSVLVCLCSSPHDCRSRFSVGHVAVVR